MAEPEPEPERQPQPEPEPEPEPPGAQQAAGSAKRVLFIRHGESVANVEAKQKIPYRDHTVDAPLTPLGMRQARSWRLAVASWGVETVLVSPLARAIQTADAVFSELPEQRMEICLSIRERWWRNPECHARPSEGYDDLNRPDDGSDYETLGDVCARRFGEGGLRRLQGTEPGWDHAAEQALSRRLLTQAENAAVHSVAEMVEQREETVLALVTHWGVIERLLRVKDAENCEVLWAELRAGSWSVLRRLRPTLDG